ncbi:hypothetical protein A4D02_23085 [Niastella koreensis]|uniref:Uncharacterized protein n=1 Tax=Niastella koreensis TaxID=354356 RepID=A0ABX3P233_9BACT|nr:hypothetical protein A4D02_23085 [Niastella koreensis]
MATMRGFMGQRTTKSESRRKMVCPKFEYHKARLKNLIRWLKSFKFRKFPFSKTSFYCFSNAAGRHLYSSNKYSY